jgi:hypothetical protein
MASYALLFTLQHSAVGVLTTGVLGLSPVMAAVMFLGEDFSFINGIGLVVLVAGVALFNYTKYHRLISGEAHIVTPAIMRRDADAFLGGFPGKDGKEGSGDEEDPEVWLPKPLHHPV